MNSNQLSFRNPYPTVNLVYTCHMANTTNTRFVISLLQSFTYHIPATSPSNLKPSMASFHLSLCILLTVLCFCNASNNFNVGGKDGWTLHPSESYSQWSGRLRFIVNDNLHFKYNGGTDSVLVVKKEDYDSCNTNSPITSLTGGDSVFNLNRPGPFYFISGNKSNCDQGQKLTVVVITPKSPPGGSPSPPGSGSPGSPGGGASSPPSGSPGSPGGGVSSPPSGSPGSPGGGGASSPPSGSPGSPGGGGASSPSSGTPGSPGGGASSPSSGTPGSPGGGASSPSGSPGSPGGGASSPSSGSPGSRGGGSGGASSPGGSPVASPGGGASSPSGSPSPGGGASSPGGNPAASPGGSASSPVGSPAASPGGGVSSSPTSNPADSPAGAASSPTGNAADTTGNGQGTQGGSAARQAVGIILSVPVAMIIFGFGWVY